jgi:hypothetical protein
MASSSALLLLLILIGVCVCACSVQFLAIRADVVAVSLKGPVWVCPVVLVSFFFFIIRQDEARRLTPLTACFVVRIHVLAV